MNRPKFCMEILLLLALCLDQSVTSAFVLSPSSKTIQTSLDSSTTTTKLSLLNVDVVMESSLSTFLPLLSDTAAAQPFIGGEEQFSFFLLSSTTAATTSSWLTNTDVWVFVAGIIPFAWATVQFWTRIATGQPFGTGDDFIYIGKDNVPEESRGQKTLDRGAFLVAYVLFGIAAAAIGITLYSVITSPPLPPSL